MSSAILSPFAKPIKGLRIKEGAPPVQRPTKEEIANFPMEAENLLKKSLTLQTSLINKGNYNIDKLKGRHFLLAGATGPGLGGALASAVMELVKDSGSITILSRDLTKSIGYETGVIMQAIADKNQMGNRFHWLNTGIALEGTSYDKIIATLKEAKANNIIYINTVASASSGLLPNYPPVYVKDVDDEGLFQWQLTPLNDREIESTKLFMGTMATQFPSALEKEGIKVDISAFADWRGSLDRISRNPDSIEYGRQGAYSTSLYLPKDILQEYSANHYGTGKKVIDIFLPVMRTRALAFIPGGVTMSALYEKLMNLEGVSYVEIPELALGVLKSIHNCIHEGDDNPFPRLDSHEMPFELWFYEVVKKLNNDENSDFYYKNWINIINK
ncbi:MAG: hypothetical protein OEV44_10320 [Spirochaetota bacterium]|nr:hypothetical protein [Spirochaetota bacterium]